MPGFMPAALKREIGTASPMFYMRAPRAIFDEIFRTEVFVVGVGTPAGHAEPVHRGYAAGATMPGRTDN
jgi:hypothetical protein